MCERYAITLAPEAMRQTFMTYGELPNRPPIYNAALLHGLQHLLFHRNTLGLDQRSAY